MALLKKSLKRFNTLYEKADYQLEMAESAGVEMIRIRSVEKAKMNPMHGVQSIMQESISGFDIFDPSQRKNVYVGKVTLYPGIDHYLYGYVPVTDRNLRLLAAFHSGGKYIADDREGKAIVAEAIEEFGCRTERIERRYNFGIDDIHEKQKIETKKRQLENLKEEVENKKLDDEIAALQAELNESKQVEPEPQVEVTPAANNPVKEEPVAEEEPKEDKPAQKRRSLAGKSVNKK